jgi:uncharacterized protein
MRPFRTAVTPLSFFVLTYVLSWLVWLPLAMSHFGIGPFNIPESTSGLVRLLGVLMPATSALILTARNGGGAALKALLSRLVLWRVGWRWWAVAGLLQPTLLVVAALLAGLLLGGGAVAMAQVASIGELSVNVIFLLIATLGEEIGWRGVALPALQQRNSPLKASIILGLVWAVWHVPFWLLLDTFDQFGIVYLLLNVLLILPSNTYISWFFNHGQFSLLLALVFHLTFNIVNTALIPVTTSLGAFAILIVLEWVVAFLVSPHLESEQTRALRDTRL